MKNETDKLNKQHHSILQRWSKRKLDSINEMHRNDYQRNASELKFTESVNENSAHKHDTYTEIPDIDSLTEDSDVASFFTDQVSDALRKAALRKIFHLGKFNVCDGLDDYAEDYTLFEPLENIALAKPQWPVKDECVNQQPVSDETTGRDNASTDDIVVEIDSEKPTNIRGVGAVDSNEAQNYLPDSVAMVEVDDNRHNVDREPTSITKENTNNA